MVYINNREHDDPHELPKDNSEGSLAMVYNDYIHADIPPKVPEEIEKLEYICGIMRPAHEFGGPNGVFLCHSLAISCVFNRSVPVTCVTGNLHLSRCNVILA